MLHGPEEHVGPREDVVFLVREQPFLGKQVQRLERVPFPKRAVAARIDELERLDHELDLADAAVPQLHVAVGPALLLHVLVDLLLHVADLGDGAVIEIFPVHERRDALQELPAQASSPATGRALISAERSQVWPQDS